MERRDFIQEMIDMLRRYSNSIESDYAKLKNKEISVEKFEEEYRNACYEISNDFRTEYDSPNNHCTYVLNDKSEVMSNDYSNEE